MTCETCKGNGSDAPCAHAGEFKPGCEAQVPTDVIADALRVLANDIQTDDGVASAAILQAADRLDYLEIQTSASDLTAVQLEMLRAEIEAESKRAWKSKDSLKLSDPLNSKWYEGYAVAMDWVFQALPKALK